MTDLESALEQQLSHIPETKLESQLPENCHWYDVFRKLKVITG